VDGPVCWIEWQVEEQEEAGPAQVTAPRTATSFETLTAEIAAATGHAPESSWRVTVVGHPDASRLGASAALAVPGELVIGRRAEWLGAGVLRDERMSREHAALCLASSGALSVEDRASHNGTFVGGERIERRDLREGDVVTTGRISLLVQRRPRVHVSTQGGAEWVAASAPMAAAMRDVARLAKRGEPVAVVGEPGSGRSSFALRLHEASGRKGALVVLSPATIGDELVMPALFGNEVGAYPGATEARAGWIEQAHGGTLVIDGLEAARPALASAVAGFLDRGVVTRVGAARPTPLDVRIVVVAAAAPHAGADVAPALAAHLGAIVRVPALRERSEDIPILVARRTATPENGGLSREIDEPLLRALLAYGWPGNLRELTAFVSRACAATESGPLRLTPELAADLGAERDLAREPRRDGRASIARSGSFFTDGEGRRVELSTRRALRNVLACLAEGSGDGAKRFSVEDLFASGWPGERASATAASSRVYVALATLRREGLKDHVQRDEGGYFLDLQRVEIVEA
jgi:hypothetical protein